MTEADGSATIGQLHHIGIVVPLDTHASLERTLVTALEMEPIDRDDGPLDVRWTWLARPQSPILELLSLLSEQVTAVSEFMARTGGGLHRLSFEIEGIEACRARLHEHGAAAQSLIGACSVSPRCLAETIVADDLVERHRRPRGTA